MKIRSLSLYPDEWTLTTGQVRTGAFIHLTDEQGRCGWGEMAPLPNWSKETLEDCLRQFHLRQQDIRNIHWTIDSWVTELTALNLLPAFSFGLESALLSLLIPLGAFSIPVSALFMGSPQDILAQASLRHQEGYRTAKLKVSHLTFQEAESLIHQLKDLFRLRIDVNRAWTTQDSLRFFSKFPLDTFDYVEEPFINPHDLACFPHPLAVDESAIFIISSGIGRLRSVSIENRSSEIAGAIPSSQFSIAAAPRSVDSCDEMMKIADESYPSDLSLNELESLPTLKAIIYKPTIQGGLLRCLPLNTWARRRDVSLVLSSSFESELGLAYVASIAHQLSLSSPIGIGTYHYLGSSSIRFPAWRRRWGSGRITIQHLV